MTEMMESSVCSDRLTRRIASLERKSPLSSEEKRGIEATYQYTYYFALPVISHWVGRVLESFKQDPTPNKYILVYLRDAYPFLRISQSMLEREKGNQSSLIPLLISRESVKDPSLLSYLFQQLPKEIVAAPKISFWHVDIGTYGTLQKELFDQLRTTLGEIGTLTFIHNLALLEFIPGKWRIDKDLVYHGGKILPYYIPEDNDHIFIHLVEGLFNLSPKVKGYQKDKNGRLHPVYKEKASEYLYQHAARVALEDYLEQIREGRISLPSSQITPSDFLTQHFLKTYELIEELSSDGPLPPFLQERLDLLKEIPDRQHHKIKKDILSIIREEPSKNYISIIPLEQRKDCLFYSLYGAYGPFLADFDDLLFSTMNEVKGLSFDTTTISYLAEKIEKNRELKQINEFVKQAVDQYEIPQTVFESIDFAQRRIKERKYFPILQQWSQRRSICLNNLNKLGILSISEEELGNNRLNEINRQRLKKFYRDRITFWHPDVWAGLNLPGESSQLVKSITQVLNDFIKPFYE
jgi:hypothetical protein